MIFLFLLALLPPVFYLSVTVLTREDFLRAGRSGMTIFEIIIATALAAIVGGYLLISINPLGQMAQARNSSRKAGLETILNGVRSNINDYRTGVFSCTAGDIPTSSERMRSGGASGTYDIAGCLVPTYLDTMPYDPSTSSAHYANNSDYDTGYYIVENSTTGQITVSAPAAELGQAIAITH